MRPENSGTAKYLRSILAVNALFTEALVDKH